MEILSDIWAILTGIEWDSIAGVATVVAVVLAAYEIAGSRRESRTRATFEHLREIDTRLNQVNRYSLRKTRKELLASYSEKKAVLTEGALSYQALLNSLELLCLALKAGAVDPALSKRQLKALCQEHVVSTAFLDEFRQCCGTDLAYEELYSTIRGSLMSRTRKRLQIVAKSKDDDQPKQPPPQPTREPARPYERKDRSIGDVPLREADRDPPSVLPPPADIEE